MVYNQNESFTRHHITGRNRTKESMQMLINKFIEYDLFESVEILIPELKRDSPSIY